MDLKARESCRPSWTFLSNHGNVLLAIARNPNATLREVAALAGITERTVQRVIVDLEAGQYLERVRTGRRNRYKVRPDVPLRHPIAAHRDIGSLIQLVADPRFHDEDPGSHPGGAIHPGDQSSDPAEARPPSRDPASKTRSPGES